MEVTLKSLQGKRRTFSILQAKKLLTLPNSAWKLDDEKFIFENNELQKRPNTKVDSSKKESKK